LSAALLPSGPRAWAQAPASPDSPAAPAATTSRAPADEPESEASPAPAANINPAQPAPERKPASTTAQPSSAPVVEQVDSEDVALEQAPPTREYEPPIPPPPTPLSNEEIASLALALGFATSFGDIDRAFPWGFNIGLHGSVRVSDPLHVTAGMQLASLRLRDAGSTGYIICDGYTCAEETESGLMVSLPVGLAMHVPIAAHKLILGAGGLWTWYSADTLVPSDVRKGPGVYGKVTWSIPGSRWVRYDVSADWSTVFSSGERFSARLSHEDSTDFWLNFSFALRFLL
jgi:hypothetical protein